jgi:23S rRNA (cytidine1920-2'-O)/16S rRNA (cytidine1409-2'-O)-methyltransferase
MKRVILAAELARMRPDLEDADAVIAEGRVLVDGVVVANPRSRVRRGCSIVVREPSDLRGSVKLRAALDEFGVDPAAKVALDIGAAAGGFTRVLLERGAARVYAVDAGHGQLVGSLRQDRRVVNLEATNIGELTAAHVPDAVDLVVVDVSYLALAEAVRQLAPLRISPGAELIGLVKPMFELRLATAPTDRPALDRALEAAVAGVSDAGWEIVATMDSPVEGAGGARELFVHARRLVL